MTPEERDAHLQGALRHAPDAALVPAPALSEAILKEARAKARDPVSKPRRQRSGLPGLWDWLARPSVATGFAGVMAAVLVGLMWWDQPMDEAQPRRPQPAPSAAPHAMTAPAAPPPAPFPTESKNNEAAPAAPSQARELARETAQEPAQAQAADKERRKPAPKAAGPRADAQSDTQAEPQATPPGRAQVQDQALAQRAEESMQKRKAMVEPAPAATMATAPAPVAPAAPPAPAAAPAMKESADAAAVARSRFGGSSAAPQEAEGRVTGAPASALALPPAKPAPAAEIAVARSPERAAFSALRALLAAETSAWAWQRGDGAAHSMDGPVLAWLSRLDTTVADWRARTEPVAAPRGRELRLLREGRVLHSLRLTGDAVLWEREGAPPVQAVLSPAALEALQAALDAATP